MRVLFFTLIMFAFLPGAMAAENSSSDAQSEAPAHTHHCPMHPEETGMEGDNCPICGMHLVPMENKAMDMDAEHEYKMHSPAAPTKDGVKSHKGTYLPIGFRCYVNYRVFWKLQIKLT